MNKKRLVIPIAFVLVLNIAMLSGCIWETVPVETLTPRVEYDFEYVHLKGRVAVPFCKAQNHKFVYDTEPHENWEDYAIKVPVRGMEPTAYLFAKNLFYGDVEHGVTYYVRAVANCYDFKRPFDDYEEGYYQGEDKTFIVVPYSVIR